MKKLTIGIAVLLSGLPAHSFAAVAAGVSPNRVCVPSLCGGFNFSATGLWWRPTTEHIDYAIRFPGVFQDTPFQPFGPLPVIFQQGRYATVDTDHHWGFALNVGYVFPCTGNDLVLAYAHYDRDDSDSITRNGGAILPSVSSNAPFGNIIFPVTPTSPVFDFTPNPPFFDVTLYDIFAFFNPDNPYIEGVPLDFASATADFKYNAWDLEFGQHLSVGCNMRMRIFTGIRYAKLEHTFDASYVGRLVNVDVVDAVFFPDPPPVGAEATLDMDAVVTSHQKSSYEGVGPRLGIHLGYNFGCGFGILVETSSALLVGEIDSHLQERFHTAATLTETIPTGDPASPFVTQSASVAVNTLESFKHPDATRIAANVEGKIGLDYSYQRCNPSKSKLTVEVGYMVTDYITTIDRLTDVGGFSPEFRTRHTIDNSFDGPYITVQYQM